jgi:abhydrolase domain-containing protein 6
MGGLIAVKYAKKYPNKISSLAFIGAPLGIKTPKISKTDDILKSGENPFIPLTTQKFHQEMELLFTTPPKLSDEQIQKRIVRYQEEKDKDLRIWSMIEKDSSVLNSPLEIKKPTLIIWGDNDNIYDVSGAEILKNNIKNSELIVIKNGSNLLFIENPILIANNYLNFLKRNSGEINAN